MASDQGSVLRPREVILADDLSGALEVGACFAGGGRKVLLPLQSISERSPGRELVVLSTETRNASEKVAHTRVRDTCRAFLESGAVLLLKKIDSTLRGPVGAELEAVLEVFPEAVLIVCPANPAAGRTVQDGVLRIHGIKISNTAFRQDPHWPIGSSRVVSIVGSDHRFKATFLPLQTIREGAGAVEGTLQAARAGGRRVVFADAETPADLRVLVSVAADRPRERLLIGSGGLARAVAAQMRQTREDASTGGVQPIPPENPRAKAEAVLYVVGSKHPISLAQLERLRALIGIEVFECEGAASIPAGDELSARIAAALRDRGAAGLRFAAGKGGAAGAIDALTSVVAQLVNAPAIVATGGETAFAICERLHASALEIVGEIEPGVVVGRASVARGEVLVVTKPGGFGDEHTLVRVHRHLAAPGLRV